MDLMQVRGFHRINGESRMPNTNEHLKFTRWNNDLGVFEYLSLEEAGDIHLQNVTQEGDTVTLIMSNGTTWEVTIPDITNLTLPGDTKILFDENDSIGGRSNLTYDYVNHRLALIDSQGIFGKNNTYDDNIQNLIQYLGQNSLYINFGNIKAPSSMINNNAIGYNALASLIEGENNIALGAYAGSNVNTNISDSVFIGSYAGRLEQEGGKFYLGIEYHDNLQDSRDSSLLYGDFYIGRLWVNNRLSITEEVKIGDFNTDNTPEGGMVRMTDAGGDLLKPQYYDNTQWVDFANGLNYYVDNITNVGTQWTFTRVGLPDIVVTIPDTYYPASGNKYRVQLSNGDNNFIHSDNLSWSINNILSVNGAVSIKTKSIGDFTPEDGIIINTGDHVYMYLDGIYKQLDNETTAGERNHGENIGTSVEVYAGMNPSNKNLQFYELKEGVKINIYSADINGDILFDVDYTVNGSNLGSTGVPLYKDTSHGENFSTLNFKRLFSSDSSISITAYDDYLDVKSTGAGGGGEANTGQNIGTGSGQSYAGMNGTILKFRTLLEGNNILITTSGDEITIDTDPFVDNVYNISGGVNIYKDYTETSGKRTINLRPIKGIGIVDVALNGDIIEVSLNDDIAIPAISGVILPVATNSNKTLTWHLNYDADITNPNPTTEDIMQIKLGSNLIYNSTTNTLDSIGGSGDPLNSIYNLGIVRNPDGTVDRTNSSRNVIFKSLNNIIKTWDGSADPLTGLGWLAFENDYPVASDTQKGILQVDISNGLTIVNGILGLDIPPIPVTNDAVLYHPSGYDLHDYDEGTQGNDDGGGLSPSELKTVRRDRARASIGAAYVNGDYTEPYVASSIVVNTTGSYKDGASWGGESRGLFLFDNKIKSDWSSVELIKTKTSAPNDNTNASKVSVQNGIMDLTLDSRDISGGIGAFNFYMYNNSGTRVKVASLKGRYEGGELVADLRVKGDIKFHCTDAEMV